MPSSPYKWNARAGRYTLGGRFVRQAAIRRALDEALVSTAARARILAAALSKNSISLIEWERQMRALVKDAHLYSGALARGGWAQMRPSDYGRLGAEIKKEYTYLNRFASELSTGYALDGRFRARVDMYVQAGRKSYYDLHDAMQEERGMTEERNILSPVDSCSECPALTELGWVELGTLPQIGTRQCLRNCKCDKEYR